MYGGVWRLSFYFLCMESGFVVSKKSSFELYIDKNLNFVVDFLFVL